MNELANFNVAVEFYAKNSPLPIPVNAQTGECAILMYLIAFLIGLLVVMGLVFLVKKNAYATNVGKHQRIPESNNVNWHKPVIGVLIALICASVCVCCFTNNALTASAKSQHNGITTSKIEVAVDMQTQTIDDASFQLINDTEDYYIFDSKSTLEFTDEAKGIVSDPSSWNLVLNALNADLFKGAPDGTPYDIPSSVETFYPGQKADASLSFSQFNYDEVVKLIGKEVFVFTLIPNQHVVEIPTAIDNLTYNGTEQTGVEESTDGSYTLDEHKKINAGDYIATATLCDTYTDYKWTDNTKEPKYINWSIARAKIAIPVAIEDLTYNKEQQTGVEAASSGEYTISGNTATNAGDYDATATVTSNYMWNDGSIEDKTIPWSIARAKAQFSTPPTAVEVTYTGSNIALAIAGSCDDEFEPVYKIEGSGSDFSTSIPTSVEIGKYTINSKAKVKTAHTQNYVDGDVINLESKINKINIVAKLDIPQGKSLEVTFGEVFDISGFGVKGWKGDTPLSDEDFKTIAGGESSLSPTYKQWDNCGDYPIQINLPSEEKWDPHYSITTEDKNLTVNKKAITIEWSTQHIYEPTGEIHVIPYTVFGSYEGPYKASIFYKTYSDKERTSEKDFKEKGSYYVTAFLNEGISSTNYIIEAGEKPEFAFEILDALRAKAVLKYDVTSNDESDCTLEFVYDQQVYQPGITEGVVQVFSIYNIEKSAGDIPTIPDWCNDEYAEVTKKIKIDATFATVTKCSDNETDLHKINYWFYNLKNATSSEGFEHLNFTITECTHLFDGCINLSNLDLKDLDTSSVKDMSYMFSDVQKIYDFNFGENFNTSNVTNMEYMFNNFASDRTVSRTSITLGDKFNTSKVTNMSHMFYGDALYEINFGNAWDTSNVVNMQSMFEGWRSLYRPVDLNNILNHINTSKVEDMSYMFKNIIDWVEPQFQDYTFNFDTSHAKDLTGFFSGAYFEGTLTLGDKFTAKNATSISGMFSGCKLIKSIVFNDNFDTTNVKDMSHLFEMGFSLTLSATKLENITLGAKFKTSNVTDMNHMFGSCVSLKCENLQSILNSFDTSNCVNMNSMFINISNFNSDVTTLDLSTFVNTNVEDLGEMFHYCEKLQTLNLGNKFVTEKCKNTKQMFAYCQNLENFDFIQNFNTKNVLDMSYMFSYCRKFNKVVTLPDSFTAENATSISYMFEYCPIEDFTFGNNFNAQHIETLDFFGFSSGIEKVNFGDNFNAKSAINVKVLFSNQRSLKEINFGKNFNVCSAVNLSKLFWADESFQNYAIEKIDLGDHFNSCSAENMSYMFCDMENLTSLSIGSLVTNKAKDMNHMFSNLPKLSQLTLPTGFNTSNAENMSYMFDNLPLIESINIVDKCFGQNALDINHMFNNLPKITSLKISDNFNAVNMTNCECMFNDLALLETIEIGNSFNAKSVKNVNTMFQKLPKLKTLKIGDGFNIESATEVKDMIKSIGFITTFTVGMDFNVSKAEDLSYMFSYLDSITELTIGDNFNAHSATSMDNMFSEMPLLTKVSLGNNFNTSSNVSMKSMFKSCGELTSLDIGDKFVTSGVTDTSNLLSDCNKLTTLNNADKFITTNVTSMESMFNGCKISDWSFISTFETSNVTSMKNMFSNSTLNVFPSNFDTRKVTSFEKMFLNCKTLNGNITLGKNFTAESATTTYYMFQDCSNITGINICDSFNSSNVSSMYRMFNGCTALETLNLGSSFNTVKVTDMRYMFCGCENLVNLNLGSNFNTSAVLEMKEMFRDCKNLESIDLGSKFNTSNVTNMIGMFNGCENLGSINFGTLFDTSAVTDMSEMFNKCNKLNLTLPQTFNTKNVKNMYNMFCNLGGTKDLILPEVFDTSKVTCMNSMFCFVSCETIKLPNSFTAFNVDDFGYTFNQHFGSPNNLTTIYCNNNLYAQAGEKLKNKNLTFQNCWKMPGYDDANDGAEMAKPRSEGGYFTEYSDEFSNASNSDDLDNSSNANKQDKLLSFTNKNDENELLVTDLENHADQAAIKEDAKNEPTDDSKDIDDLAGAGVAGGAVIAPAVISQIMRRNKKNDEAEAI